MDWNNDIRAYIERETRVLEDLDRKEIGAAMDAIVGAYRKGAHVYVMGNGGSASTASHMVGDFNKGVSDAIGGKRFRFRCLSDNIATMMAIANDICYEEVFRHQLRGALEPEDVVIAISASGNSENVLRAVSYAKEVGATVISMTGYDGGKLRGMADHPLHVDIDDMQITEDVHLIFVHLMMQILSMKMKGKE